MTLPSYAEIWPKAEASFSIEGPNSGGGVSALVFEGNVYEVVYGDESRAPRGAEEVSAVYAPAVFASTFQHDPRRARVIAYLRDNGLLQEGA